MEIKTKYQYTYFIYPYVVKEKNFNKYLFKLLRNKNCELKVFEKNRYPDIYKYFLPKVRNYLFGSFEFNRSKIKKLKEFDVNMQATLLAKYPCTVFNYNLKKDIQGKIQKESGIYFDIRRIELICFNSGICFLIIKTTLNEDSTLSDLLNFNYKFRDLNSSIRGLTTLDNIKIQTDSFENIQDISELIEDLVGDNIGAKDLNLDNERFITYSYACVGQEYWNDTINQEVLEKEFYKFAHVLSADHFVDYKSDDFYKADNSRYVKYGTTKAGNVLLVSDANTENYTRLPQKFEQEYLYNYIFELYKKIYLKMINQDLKENSKFSKARATFLDFAQTIWMEDVTDDDLGDTLSEQWKQIFKSKEIFEDVKQKYDMIYKNLNVEQTTKNNRWIIIALLVIVVVNIINILRIM